MALNPRIWYSIAVVGFLVNVGGLALALGPAEPWHAGLHAALAVAFGGWARRLRARLHGGGGALDKGHDTEVAALRDEVGELRRELSDMQERMDFAERVLTQAREKERVAARQPGK